VIVCGMGEKRSFDLVVDASGSRSKLRQCLNDQAISAAPMAVLASLAGPRRLRRECASAAL